jgi:hypothetical protein
MSQVCWELFPNGVVSWKFCTLTRSFQVLETGDGVAIASEGVVSTVSFPFSLDDFLG